MKVVARGGEPAESFSSLFNCLDATLLFWFTLAALIKLFLAAADCSF